MTPFLDSIASESEIVSEHTFSTVHSLPNYASFLFQNDTSSLASCSMYSLQSTSTISLVRRLTSSATNVTNSTDPAGPTDVSFNAVLTSLTINSVLFVVLVILYEILRRIFPGVYSIGRTSRHTKRNDDGRSSIERRKSTYSERLDPIETAVFPLWIPDLVSIPWSKVLSVGGLDAYMFLRYIRMCMRIMFATCIWSIFILFPVYVTGDMEAEGWYHLSMANVKQSSWRIWVPTVFMWFMSVFVLWSIREEYLHFTIKRMEFLGTTEENIDVTGVEVESRYSIMVEQIPRELRSDAALFGYFNEIFPGKVHSASVVLKLPQLEKLCARRLQVTRRIEKSVAYTEATGKRATHVVGRSRCMCCGVEGQCCGCLPKFCCGSKKKVWDEGMSQLPEKGDTVDSISYYTREVAFMNEEVASMQKERIELADQGTDDEGNWMERVAHAVSDSAALVGVRDQQEEQRPSAPEESARSPLIDSDYLDHGEARTHVHAPLDNSNVEDLRITNNYCRKLIGCLGWDFVMACFQLSCNRVEVYVDSIMDFVSSTGFITFKDLTTAACANSAAATNTRDVLKANMAPEPRDIIWKNCHVDSKISKRRERISNVLFALGAIMWSFPLLGIQFIATAEHLAMVPGLSWITKSENAFLINFINGYLPVVLLLGIIQLLPLIFGLVANLYEKRKTKSDIQHSILGRFFYYQLANIYITVTAGTIFNALHQIIESPQEILIILGTSLPKMVGYFISLLLTKILAGLPLTMLRLGALSRFLLLRICFRKKTLTQRELDEGLYKQEPILYGREYPTQFLVIVICFTYACISPIILVFGTVYFMGVFLVFKKQVLFTYTALYESGGQFFPSACDRTLFGLICGQITFIGYCIIRKGFYQAYSLAPLPFITLFFIYQFKKHHRYPSRCLGLARAAQIDKINTIESRERFKKDAYRQPVLAEGAVEPLPYRENTPGTGSNHGHGVEDADWMVGLDGDNVLLEEENEAGKE